MKKKKNKKEENPQQGMPDIAFKEFTSEEDAIYHETVNAYRLAVEEGKTLKEAYESVAIENTELRNMIQADFLKIMIAELHYGKGMHIEELAQKLSVSTELIQDTIKRMLQEVGMKAAQEFAKQSGLSPETSD